MSYLPCKNQASVGIDLGIKHFAVLSDGIFIDNPKTLSKNLKKLKRLSRQSTDSSSGSNACGDNGNESVSWTERFNQYRRSRN